MKFIDFKNISEQNSIKFTNIFGGIGSKILFVREKMFGFNSSVSIFQ